MAGKRITVPPGGLVVHVHVDAHAARRWMLPPVVLAELRENAVKHNELGADNPLEIDVRRDEVSSTGVAARWGEGGDRFIVTLPLLAEDGSNIAQ